jgi:hypothetical protein
MIDPCGFLVAGPVPSQLRVERLQRHLRMNANTCLHFHLLWLRLSYLSIVKRQAPTIYLPL